MRGVKSLAYDLVVPQGRVSSRVALLLRSTERQPAGARFFSRREYALSPTHRPAISRAMRGGDRAVGGETITRASGERECWE